MYSADELWLFASHWSQHGWQRPSLASWLRLVTVNGCTDLSGQYQLWWTMAITKNSSAFSMNSDGQQYSFLTISDHRGQFSKVFLNHKVGFCRTGYLNEWVDEQKGAAREADGNTLADKIWFYVNQWIHWLAWLMGNVRWKHFELMVIDSYRFPIILSKDHLTNDLFQ